MEKEIQSVLEKALKMKPKQRAFIAERLLNSLEAKRDAAVEAAWQEEIQRRMAEADKDAAVFMSWEEAKQKIEG